MSVDLSCGLKQLSAYCGFMSENLPPVFRLAPSPNGELHLGHAYSALLNQHRAQEAGGKLLLRMEDIDLQRCRPEFEAQMLDDLEWLGVEFETPIMRQSERFSVYQSALTKLLDSGLAYPAFMSRKEIREAVAPWGVNWPCDPDGVPHYPGEDRHLTDEQRHDAMAARPNHAIRLNMERALAEFNQPLGWIEQGQEIAADAAVWGDVVLGRSDTPASYHLSVVMDDATQKVTQVVRGKDLYHATSVHRLLQELLELPAPNYEHHDLVRDGEGRKLAKSQKDRSIASLRREGMTAEEVKAMVGWPFGDGDIPSNIF